MLALEIIAERKIEEAIARGELDELPGAGQPLDLDDVDPLLPEELRMAYRILRNAGMGPDDMDELTTWRRSSPRDRRSTS
jgi:hypothetical protein